SYRLPGVPTQNTIELRNKAAGDQDHYGAVKKVTVDDILGPEPRVNVGPLEDVQISPNPPPYSSNEIVNDMVEGVLGPRDRPSWIKRVYDELAGGKFREAATTEKEAYVEGLKKALPTLTGHPKEDFWPTVQGVVDVATAGGLMKAGVDPNLAA